jgi:uncharacterized protein YqeY
MMVNKAELETALKEALRSGDALRKTTLRMVLSAIKLAEIEKGVSLDENGILSVLQKEVKSRREAIIDAQRANRPDLVTASEAEIVILESFLPKAMSPEELEALARRAIQEVGATSPREMGQVMKVLIPLLQGRASGDQASQMVKKLLQ